LETVLIQIPAELYTAIYACHGEETSTAIKEHLNQLLGSNTGGTPPNNVRTQHFMRPGEGTITGRVWEIADQLVEETGSAERDAVVMACMDEGIKINTANTQYSHWKKAIWG